MAIEYAERLPEAHEYRGLFDTTGWNEFYSAGTDELIAALSASGRLSEMAAEEGAGGEASPEEESDDEPATDEDVEDLSAPPLAADFGEELVPEDESQEIAT